jgi:hypothetical protein
MNKLVVVAFILGLSGIGAQAMPLASVQTPDGMIIKVKDGCGPGFYLHRTRRFGDLCQPSPYCRVRPLPAFCGSGKRIQ